MSNKPYQKAIAIVWHDSNTPMLVIPIGPDGEFIGYSARIVDIDEDGNVCTKEQDN